MLDPCVAASRGLPPMALLLRRWMRPAHLTGFLLSIAAFFCASPARAVDVPSGFIVENVTPGAVWDTPVSLVFMPGGRMLVAEKRGRVYIVLNGVKRSTPLWSMESEVLNMTDRGLLDVAVDPNYVTNHYIYLLYTVDPPGGTTDGDDPGYGRLVRYQVSFSDSNALDMASATYLFGATWPTGPCSGSPSHTIGSLRWGRDGSLLVSVGEGASYSQMDPGGLQPTMFGSGKTDPSEDIGAFRAQSLSSLAGKILRINPANGQGYSSNPYYNGNANSPRSKVWAYGFRNPYRFTVKPGTGSTNPSAGDPGVLYVGDVGWQTWEELDTVTQPGQNFGWPCYETLYEQGEYQNASPAHNDCNSIGTSDNPATPRQPIANWKHTDPDAGTPPGFMGSAVVGGTFYTATSYPSQYRNRFFFADFSGNWIKVAVTDANHNLTQILPFAEYAEAPVCIVPEPGTGDLIYISIAEQELRRIRYTGGSSNGPPVAVVTANPYVGVAPLDVAFSSAGSSDPDNDTLTFAWNFGDGGTSTQANPQHTYADPGVYQALLTVNDGHGHTAQDGAAMTVGTQSTAFPSTGVLDNFNRSNGPIGGMWVGNTSALAIQSSQLVETGPDASTVWNGGVFGASQEAYFRFDQITSNASEHDLMLKVQGLDWSTGHIEVHYDVTGAQVYVNTYDPANGWIPHGGTPVTLQPGDQLGARADLAGNVTVYRNGVAIYNASVTNWPFYAQGGRLGMTIVDALGTHLDDFGGGTMVTASNTAPQATIETPFDGGFFCEGDTIRLSASAIDGEEPSAGLSYHWDVYVHHNNHVHPSSYSCDTPTGEFVGENHDDGSGVWLDVVLRVTDSGGLADTAHVALFPQTDLEVSPVLVFPQSPTNVGSARYRFKVWNHGCLPAPFSRWVLRAGNVNLAQGDTVVAGHDSLDIDLWAPPLLAPGNYDLRVVADSLGAIHETDETNNTHTQPLVVVVAQAGAGAPERLDLAISEGFPNPSAGVVALALALPGAARVEMAVHDLQGREVWRTAPRRYAAGRWTLEWPGTMAGRPARPGLYLARVTIDGRAFTRRLAIVR
jgi:glucose/arabinose dehydrogenase